MVNCHIAFERKQSHKVRSEFSFWIFKAALETLLLLEASLTAGLILFLACLMHGGCPQVPTGSHGAIQMRVS